MATKETESNITRGKGLSGLTDTTTTKQTKAVASTPVAVAIPTVTAAVVQPATARNNKFTGAALNTAGH